MCPTLLVDVSPKHVMKLETAEATEKCSQSEGRKEMCSLKVRTGDHDVGRNMQVVAAEKKH